MIHIILDNEAYESTGGQPAISASVDLAAVGESCGYLHTHRVASREALEAVLVEGLSEAGPHLVLVKVAIAPVEGIPRVSHAPTAIRDRFAGHLRNA